MSAAISTSAAYDPETWQFIEASRFLLRELRSRCGLPSWERRQFPESRIIFSFLERVCSLDNTK
jgi:hypothetical protein